VSLLDRVEVFFVDLVFSAQPSDIHRVCVHRADFTDGQISCWCEEFDEVVFPVYLRWGLGYVFVGGRGLVLFCIVCSVRGPLWLDFTVEVRLGYWPEAFIPWVVQLVTMERFGGGLYKLKFRSIMRSSAAAGQPRTLIFSETSSTVHVEGWGAGM
jgi:hypothetical protein